MLFQTIILIVAPLALVFIPLAIYYGYYASQGKYDPYTVKRALTFTRPALEDPEFVALLYDKIMAEGQRRKNQKG